MGLRELWISCAIGASLVAGSAVCAEPAEDWRLEILKESGISSETADMEKLQNNHGISAKDLDEKIKHLSSEKFAEREQAQKDIILMGKHVMPMLEALPRTDDPEISMRIGKILLSLKADGRWSKEALTERAMRSLLHDRKNPGVANPDGELFVEFFNKAKPSVADGYRQLAFQSTQGLTGSVSDGMARFKGIHDNAGDQRFILRCKDLNGKQEFPDTFRIESKLGGAEGGEGVYHVGISIGNIRALFHPGYASGAFRFERVDNHVAIIQNTPMGFTPPTGKLLLMSIEVTRLPKGDVSLDVTVSGAKEMFHNSRVIKAVDIGKLETIGLDRSGRSGGDGLFDDLIVDLGKP